MKKELRVSSMKDYIAVDIIDEMAPGEPILSTPLYLAKGKPIIVKGLDVEENKWLKTSLLFDGEKITATDIDPKSDYAGMEYEVPVADLLDEKQFKF